MIFSTRTITGIILYYFQKEDISVEKFHIFHKQDYHISIYRIEHQPTR